jgi:hypothetical protein
MSHELRLNDGEKLVYLTGGPITLQEYAPRAPDVSPTEAVAWAMEDGGEVSSVTRRNVTEPVTITVVDEDQGAVGGHLNLVEAMIRQAEEYQRRRVGRRVWIEYKPEGYTEFWRSELTYGRSEVGPTTMGLHWRAAAAEALISWHRRFYWEGPEVEVPLANGSGSGTGGRAICNHDDGDANHDNWVDVDGDDVEGVIPAPCRLEITNTYNDSDRTRNIYIAQNVWSDPSGLNHVLEAENASFKAGGAGSTSNSSASNGYHQQLAWSGDAETKLIEWTLSASLLGSAAGNYFRLLARFSTPPTTGYYIRPKILFFVTPVFEASQVQLANGVELQDLGVMQIPPWLTGETDLYPVDLTLYARKTGGGTLYMDYLMLMCLDGYRVLKPRGYGAAYTVRVVDDGILNVLWTDGWSGGQKTGHYLSDGLRIHLWPGKDQRLYFLATSQASDAEIDRTASVRCYYRPRRLTL